MNLHAVATSAGIEDQTTRFLKLILPGKGYLVAQLKGGKGFLKPEFFATVEELADHIKWTDATGFTVYHACASFNEPVLDPPNTPRNQRRFGRTTKNVCC